MSWRAIWATFAFEVRQFKTPSRLAWWIGLALFPPALGLLVRPESPATGQTGSADEASIAISILSGVVCLLGLLLSATPVVHGELEGKTWTYLAVRPHAKASIVVGKYAAAVLWSGSAGLTALTLGFPVLGIPEVTRWLQLSAILCLASLAYGALYTLIGVLFLRRAMVVAVCYTLLVELITAWVPAVINKVTLSFRLRSLFAKTVDSNTLLPALDEFVSVDPATQQVAIVLGYAGVLLVAAVIVARRRQLVTAEE